MEITRRRLKKIIKEELYRPYPISSYSRRQLQKEGLLDFINKVFDFFIAEYQKEHSAASSAVVSTIKEKEASTLSDLAKKLNRPMSGPEDLEPKEKEDVAIAYNFACMSAGNAGYEAVKFLEQAASTQVWVPEEGKEEEWGKTEDAKTSAKVFAAVGALEGGTERIGEWMSMIGKLSLTQYFSDEPSSPAEAIKVILGWSKEVASGDLATGPVTSVDEKTQAKLGINVPENVAYMKEQINLLNAKAQEIGAAIEAGAKEVATDEAKNECVALRQVLSGIMFEQKKKKKKPASSGGGGGGGYDDYGYDDYGYDAEEEYWIDYAIDLENQEDAELIDAYLSGDDDPDDEDEFEEYEYGYDDYDDYDDDDYDDGGDY